MTSRSRSCPCPSRDPDRYVPALAARNLRVPAGEPVWVKAMVRGRGPGVGDVRYIEVQEGQPAEIELDLSRGVVLGQWGGALGDLALKLQQSQLAGAGYGFGAALRL